MRVFLLLILLSYVILTRGDIDNRVITTLKHSKFYVRPSIINGIPARDGQVPYLVSLKEPLVKVSEIKYIWVNICGGSIISGTKVLTAAHCFESKNFFFYNNPQHLRVVAGNFATELIHTGRTDSTSKAQWRSIRKVVLHEKFLFPDNDIAIVFVNAPWKYNLNVGAVRLARRSTDYKGDCIAAGFGSIHVARDEVSPVLLIGHMFLLPQKNCTRMFDMNMNNFICTYSFMSDVGTGDSGGPLACSGTVDPEERKGGPLLVGVVSGKNFDRTSLFTRVSEYRDWIERNSAYKLTIAVDLLLINHVLLAL